VSVWNEMLFSEAGIELIDCIHKTPKAVEQGFPYIGIPQMKTGRVRFHDARQISKSDFLKWTEKVCPIQHDVVVSRRTNPGVSAVFKPDEKFALGQNLVLLRSDGSSVLPEFLRWMVHGPYWWGQINKFINVGAVFDSLRCGDFKDFKLPIPPKNEQLKISVMLAAIDDKVELNRQMNETLEDMAQAVFKDWFVDFGPSLRKSQGESDPVKILGGLIADKPKATKISDLFPDSFGDDDLPMGWTRSNIDNEFDVTMGQSPPGATLNEKGDGIVFFQGRRDFKFRFPTERVATTDPKRLAKRDSVLISVRAPVGDINRAAEDCAIGRGVGSLRHKKSLTSFAYYFALALKTELQSYDNDGTVFGSINQKQLRSLEVIKTNSELEGVFNKIAEPLDQLIRNNTEENQTLAETRDYLLPKLMSGEVRVGDAVSVCTEKASNVVPMGGDLFDRKALPADKDLERDSAIVAGVIAALQKDTEVVGNVKYQKGCYFVYRRKGYSTRDFEQKAAGPYSRKIVDGGYARAISQKYIRHKSDSKYPGNLPARNISAANALATQYKLGDALAWVKQHLSGKSRGELELWATADYAMIALRNRGTTPTADTVIDYIRNEPEWAAKLKKASFTKSKIGAAIVELDRAFGVT